MDNFTILLVRNQVLNFQFSAPYNSGWGGRLPAGLNVTNGGLGIAGTVNDLPGTYIAEFRNPADTVVGTFILSDPNPLAPPDFVCAGSTLVNGVMTVTTAAGAIAIQMTATNSGGNWTGSFPSGVGINSFGLISGTLAPGSYSLVVQASNNAWWFNSYTYGPTQTATYALHLVVTAAVPVVSVSSQYSWFGGNFTVGDDMPNATIFAVQDYAKPVTWSATGLPDGVVINPASGYITGKMNTPGSFNAVITATNTSGSGTFTQQINVAENHNPPVVTLAQEQPGNANQNSYGNVQLSFAVGSPVMIYLDGTNNPTSWSAADLPSGLAIDAETGIVSGILRAPSSYRFFVTASNSAGDSNALGVTVTATGVAQAFRFVGDDPSLTDVQIDVRSGTVSSSQPQAFKQLQRVRLALIFLDYGEPVTPPNIADVTVGIRLAGQYDGDYLFPAPEAVLVPAADGHPAYLLVEFTVDNADINGALVDAISAAAQGTTAPMVNAMAEVAWKQGGIQRISKTFTQTYEPAVTDTEN